MLLATGSIASAAPPACPGPGAPVLERFTSADCTECWAAPEQVSGAGGWLFDWLTPTPNGADAPLAVGAPVEAGERARRAGAMSPVGQQVLVLRSRLPERPGLRLEARSGPAWHGYFGLDLRATGRAPAGATGWVALVEAVPAGTNGSAVARELLRAVAGPLPLHGLQPGRPLSHLRAVRVPEGATVGRLSARGWIEAADGQLLAVAGEACRAAR